jgi:hypothetical protein
MVRAYLWLIGRLVASFAATEAAIGGRGCEWNQEQVDCLLLDSF